jgi:heme-degrading monooxygenase HmoA
VRWAGDRGGRTPVSRPTIVFDTSTTVGDDAVMVLEHAVLDVRPGDEAVFEGAFASAVSLIANAKGFRSLRLERGIENTCRYLLLVEWDALSDHTEGFRGSPAYDQWRSLLHHFYDPFPTVEHFETVTAR